MGFTRADSRFMQHALHLAECAANAGEVPVGAVLVKDGEVIGAGYNQPIAKHDPSAHAEIQALRAGAKHLNNYRLPDTTLYATLEPCVMCAGAIIHARVGKVIFAASDPRTGAAGSVFNLLPSDRRFNHATLCEGGLEAAASAKLLRDFFRAKRR